MSKQDLRRPGTDPDIHDSGDRTPVGFIQHAQFASSASVHVEAVAIHPWLPNTDRHGQGRWSEEPGNFVRMTLGPNDGKGWAIAHVDLTKEQTKHLIRDLQEQVGRL